MADSPLFYCQLCEEWDIKPCGSEGHDAYVETPDPRVALLNYLDTIRAAIWKLNKE